MAGRQFVPLEIRYERHIKRGASPDECWIWNGNRNQAGYGQFRIGRSGMGRPVISVHRWAYEHFVGPIPEGMYVCHRCDNPRCSNPAHLYVGTPVENSADAKARGRRAKKHAFGPRRRKLTDEQVRAIRLDDRLAAEIALAHGISETTVWNIKRRQRKSHVPD